MGDNLIGADNQQERSVLSPDFLAGLIVGEGSYFIGIRRQKIGKPDECVTLYPAFSLRMNDEPLMTRVCEFFAAHNLYLYRNPAIYHRCVSVSVAGVARMREHLDFFLPLLAGNKLRAAQAVSRFTDRRIENFNRRFDEEDLVLLEEVRNINGPTRARLSIEILRDYMSRPHSRSSVG